MRIKNILAEDFCNYKLPSMFIITATCDWKCGKELCQNSPLAQQPEMVVSDESIYKLYHDNDITKAIVLGGLEPILQIDEVVELISLFRDRGEDAPFVIYTGYNEDEITSKLERLRPLGNIIVKFGRYIPGQKPHKDEVLGVELASDNQYAEWIDNKHKKPDFTHHTGDDYPN